jgi:DNA-binding LacI/PurR family transcriptional regulator
MPYTIRDVAARAGVSVSTVSKVLNGWTSISGETAERVNRIVQELHYIPNARAVNFARKSSKNIVFLTSLEKEEAYKNPHMFDIMCGVYHELSKYEYNVTMQDISQEKYAGETAENIISQCSADGIVVHGSALNRKTADLITQKGFPHTVIGNPPFENQLCWVDTSHLLGGQVAADYLLQCGYTSVAFIGGRANDFISEQRLKGLRQIMLRSGHRMNTADIIHTDSSRQAAYKAAFGLIHSEHCPQVIVCEDNLIALSVSRAIEHSGLSVPGDIAFVTFDRYPYADIIDPLPTIIDIDVYALGELAGKTIAQKLANPLLLVQSYSTLPVVIQGQTTRQPTA